MRKFHKLFVSSFLLSSCLNTPSQDADIAATSESLLHQKEINKLKETDDSHLSIALSGKLDKISSDLTKNFALSMSEQGQVGLGVDDLPIPNEIMLQIFSELSVAEIAQASQVCHRWYEITKNPVLWRTVRLRIHGDYPANEATKEQAKLHLLRVRVNTLSELAEIKRLITKYDLNKGRPFVRYQTLAYEFIDKLSPDLIEEQIAQGSEVGIERKIEGLAYDEYGYDEYEYDDDYDQNLEAIACNEQWVERGNEKAIGRKIDGITCGRYGYEMDVKAAFELNEWFVKQGYEAAIERKVRGLVVGQYGYKKDSRASFELNEHFAEQGNQKAINRKIKGLTYKLYGYPEDRKAAFNLNEYSIVQGNPKAITRKVMGLAYGRYGYEKNLDAALAFNQWLIEEGNEGAIIRKVKSLAKKKSRYSSDLPLYQKDLTQLKNWLEEEAMKGTRWACYLKAQGLKHGILGFEEDPEAAVSYIKEQHIPY